MALARSESRLKATVVALLHYDPKLGQFFWREARGGRRKGALAGSLDEKGYWCIRINRVLYKAHRLVWLLHNEDMPEIVDHINHDRTDNRIENLRAVTLSENNANMDMRSDNKSGFKGVSFHKGSGKWVAKLKGRTLGYFASPELASKAYTDAARAEFGVHFNDTSAQTADRRRY